MKARCSPNHDARPPGAEIDTLVLHYTGMPTAEAALARLSDPEARVSAHYLVDDDGAIWQLVAEGRRAWHAGASFWRGQTDINARSIGIEIVNPGHEWGYRPFPAAQIEALLTLCRAVLARHPIAPRNVVAHSDIAPERKQDPGELFAFAWLARNGIGLFPEAVHDLGTGDAFFSARALRAVRADLISVGYKLAPEGPLDRSLAVVLSAFQRHWRPEAITGAADRGTRARLAALTRLLAAPVASAGCRCADTTAGHPR
ncbi:MAG: N-acetylmuramoyl-L-alanine amidase [Acetobacteraceae bacterium]